MTSAWRPLADGETKAVLNHSFTGPNDTVWVNDASSWVIAKYEGGYYALAPNGIGTMVYPSLAAAIAGVPVVVQS